MWHSLREKLMPLNYEAIVYPAHGAGTLCGKALSDANSSTIGEEKKTNWSLQPQTEGEFVKELLSDQTFIPAYFSFEVALNKKGETALQENIKKIKIGEKSPNELDRSYWIVDVRKEKDFKEGHLPHSINLMEIGKFETCLGSIIKPNEKFYLAVENQEQLQRMMERVAVIGYETSIAAAFVMEDAKLHVEKINVDEFKKHTDDNKIVDVRNGKIFDSSISIPLAEVRNRVNEIPTDKPIVVHCAGGYRSAAASSLIQSKVNGTTKVFDLGEAVKEFE